MCPGNDWPTSLAFVPFMGRSGGAAYLYLGGFKSHDSQASTCSSPGSSESWLRHPCFEVYRKITRKLLKRHLIVILGLKLHVNRFSLARTTGPFSYHNSFCLVKVNGRLREVRGVTFSFLDPLYETQLITAWRFLMSATLTSRA